MTSHHRSAWLALALASGLLLGGAGAPAHARLAPFVRVPGHWPAAPWRPHDPPHPPAPVSADDPLAPMLQRIHYFLRLHEVDGVTMDSRYAINPSEAIRMGVVSQLLGYTELAKMRPGIFRREILAHGRFLASRLDSVRSGTPFDGMLGYALLQAFERSGDSSFLDAGGLVVAEMKAIPTYQCVLNGGLMVAMATADWALLTGDPVAAQKTSDIVGSLAGYVNADGSFPHWCQGSEDIHYTGWMAAELVLIQRMTGDPRIEPYLGGMRAFIESRLDTSGITSYTGPCAGIPNCTRYYDSQHSGCGYDYDTRAWTVEPAYNAHLLDRYDSPAYLPVMRFLQSLESGGTWSDKYGYIPPPNDPEYPWSIADTSVANTSINFWILATAQTSRVLRGLPVPDWLARLPITTGDPLAGVAPRPAAATGAGAGVRLEHADPNPARAGTWLRFALPGRARVTLAVFDAAGRRVRTLAAGEYDAGAHALAWDGRDERGGRCGAGLYFARLTAGRGSLSTRIVLLP
jgi:hypothetical protein